MAKRRTQTAEPRPAVQQPAPSAAAPAARVGQPSLLSENGARALIVTVFAVFLIIIVITFKVTGGESRVQTKILASAADDAKAGRYEKAIATLVEFGERWPGALKTRNYQQTLGDHYKALGKWDKAADCYIKALDADPRYRGLRALAGEAAWKTGDMEQARLLFESELKDSDTNNNMAEFYMGQYWEKNGDLLKAFSYYEAMTDTAPYEKELVVSRERIRKEVLDPARERAAKKN